MIITFENKQSGKISKAENVSSFSTGCTALGRTGFGVNYTDGTFSLFPGSEWRLICVSNAPEGEKHYAEIKWSWEDVHAVRPEWDEAKCRSWWEVNEKWFKDVLTEYGNEMLSNTLD